MYEIPKPDVLNPDRVDRDDREDLTLADHRSQSQLLAKALGESCAYADQLWEHVNAVRGYLLESLPPDPRSPGPHTTAAASPTGPDDEDGWHNWINAFAATTSVLCGTHGDSGFGLSRARQEAQIRRTAPEPTVHADHPELAAAQSAPAATEDSSSGQTPPGAPDGDPGAARNDSVAVIKAAALAVVAVLALRGLRPPVRHNRADGRGASGQHGYPARPHPRHTGRPKEEADLMQLVITSDSGDSSTAGLRGWASAAARGVAAGLAGTTVMTISLKLEQLARRRSDGPVDYDASDHVVTAAVAVLRHDPRTKAGRKALFLLVHWGYGSAVAAAYPALRNQLRSRPRATAAFYLGCQAMAMTLFPTLGGTPPPWRWKRAVLLSSFAQHAIYAVTVCAADQALNAERPLVRPGSEGTSTDVHSP